jgi:hypothetical protein
MQNRFDENNKNIGYYNHFDEFYLPERSNSLWQKLKDNPEGMGRFKLLKNSLIKMVSESIEDSDFNGIDIMGKTVKNVPISMSSYSLSLRIIYL